MAKRRRTRDGRIQACLLLSPKLHRRLQDQARDEETSASVLAERLLSTGLGWQPDDVRKSRATA